MFVIAGLVSVGAGVYFNALAQSPLFIKIGNREESGLTALGPSDNVSVCPCGRRSLKTE